MQGSSDQDRELLDAGALVGHLVAEGSVHRFLADHRHRLFPDAMFEDLFPSKRGRPSVPADVIATVMVLQALEGRSDREAIDALRTDLRWKVAAGLALDHEGFHPTVLTLWRNKLRASESPERIFDAVRAVVAETGVLAGKTRRALDSTLLDDAVATQDTVTQLVSMIRRVRKAVPAAATVEVSGHDYDSPGKPACAWDDPAARDELITGLVNDALAILNALDGIDLDDDQRQLVALLALVAGQDVEPDPERGEGTWRIVRGVASERVISTVDPESRHMHKSRSSYRDGYKAHVVVEPDTGIITNCDLTPANEGDGPVGARLLEGEDPGLDVLADSAYGSGPVRAALAANDHTAVIKPWPLGRNPNLGDDQFHRDDFLVDHAARTVTCPAGITISIHASGNATFGARCRGCPSRHRCTSAAKGKTVKLTDHDEWLVTARANWRAGTHLADYRQHRPMVERTIAWLVANGHRRVRFRGVQRNRLGLSHRAAALNLRRLLNLGLHHAPTGWAIT
ncbi:IS1182 family transposase [Acidimicrobiia bacterium EGI L10123]|uniref:IS1182 family transposase n=1 Tax=Salinilacustrithrix flava TaxID=2957203 RepID=UPI003D7C1B5D|nr:IS1182 family transposase [Acidimicrobiia bacterium EGI L10123]